MKADYHAITRATIIALSVAPVIFFGLVYLLACFYRPLQRSCCCCFRGWRCQKAVVQETADVTAAHDDLEHGKGPHFAPGFQTEKLDIGLSDDNAHGFVTAFAPNPTPPVVVEARCLDTVAAVGPPLAEAPHAIDMA